MVYVWGAFLFSRALGDKWEECMWASISQPILIVTLNTANWTSDQLPLTSILPHLLSASLPFRLTSIPNPPTSPHLHSHSSNSLLFITIFLRPSDEPQKNPRDPHSDASFPPETSPPRWWPQQKGLHFSLSTHFFLAYWTCPPLSSPLSCMYSFTLSCHFTTGLG